MKRKEFRETHPIENKKFCKFDEQRSNQISKKKIKNNEQIVDFHDLYKQSKPPLLLKEFLAKRNPFKRDDTVFMNKIDKNGNTALHFVTANKEFSISTEMIKMLINMKSDINIVNNDGDTALLNVCKRWGVSSDCIKLLCSETTVLLKDSKGNTPLHCLCKRGRLCDILEIHELYDIEKVLNNKKQSYLHIFFRYVNNLSPSILDWLSLCKRLNNNSNPLENDDNQSNKMVVDLFAIDVHGNNCLHYLCMNKYIVESKEVKGYFEKHCVLFTNSMDLSKIHPSIRYCYERFRQGFDVKNSIGQTPGDVLINAYFKIKEKY